MCPVLLLALLGAAPVDVVALHIRSRDTLDEFEAERSLTHLLKSKIVYGTSLHSYLFPKDVVIPMQDFSSFSARPAAGWPAELAPEWAKGISFCKALVGPPPWKGTEKSTGAFACANRLSRSLWQQFAAFRHASRVFEIEVTGDKSKVTVSGLRWDPASSEQIAVTQTAAMDKAEELFERVVVALVDEQGTRSPRLVEPPLEGVAGSDPYAIDSFPGASKVTDPVKLKKTCDPLPSTVEVTPAGVVADSVSARWAASVHGTAPALTCSLTFAEHDEVMLMPVTIVTGTMKCGSLTCGRRGREDAGVEA